MRRSLLALAVVLLVANARPADATPIATGEAFNLSFHATTCSGCWSGALPSVILDGTLTVVPATGSFWDPWFQTFFSGGLLVTALTGTVEIDCLGIGGCGGGGSYSLSFLP